VSGPVDPMTPFAYWHWDAPYTVTAAGQFSFAATVLPARCKTGYGTTEFSNKVHLVESAASLLYHGRMRLGATWLCTSRGTRDAIFVNAPGGSDTLCERCVDVQAGPAVYRCFAADGRLLYIGSARCHLARLANHKCLAPWWPEMAEVTTERYPTLFLARVAERKAIAEESPAHNKIGRKPLVA
jgi:hypothetical protein